MKFGGGFSTRGKGFNITYIYIDNLIRLGAFGCDHMESSSTEDKSKGADGIFLFA